MPQKFANLGAAIVRAKAALHSRQMRTIALMLPALLLAGCANENYSKKITELPTNAVPVAPAAESLMPYRVQIGDVLDLKFRLNPELDETVTVRPDGMISTGVVEDMMVYNLTVSQINEKLRESYGNELAEPRISTVVRSFAPSRIYVSGEVTTPGEFVVVGPSLTLTQAIARAGGILNSADSEQVLVIRRGAGEQGQVFLANYDAATQGGDATKDVRLAPYDVVFVPKTGVALAYKGWEQYFKQYVNPGLNVGATASID